jgi:hypothetical protein
MWRAQPLDDLTREYTSRSLKGAHLGSCSRAPLGCEDCLRVRAGINTPFKEAVTGFMSMPVWAG